RRLEIPLPDRHRFGELLALGVKLTEVEERVAVIWIEFEDLKVLRDGAVELPLAFGKLPGGKMRVRGQRRIVHLLESLIVRSAVLRSGLRRLLVVRAADQQRRRDRESERVPGHHHCFNASSIQYNAADAPPGLF